MKNIKIKVIGSQIDNNDKDDKIELLTEASFEKKDDSYIIVYDESELTGMKGTKTKLDIEKDKLTMTKYGANSSCMLFEVGKKYSTPYITSVGQIDLDIITKKYNSSIDDNGKGKIEIEYKIIFANNQGLLNKLCIETQ